MLNIAINGANGRMGREISQLMLAAPLKYKLSFVKVRTPCVQFDACPQLTELPSIAASDVLIDFSLPDSTLDLLSWAVAQQIPLVIGTTGFSSEQMTQIVQAANRIPILLSPNMSLSVNVLFKVSQLAAKVLADYEVEISESHHRYKKDAPSGTALRIGEAIANSRGQAFAEVARFDRCSSSNQVRAPQEIGFAVTRGGDIVGKHRVDFISDGEEFSLSSEISNRRSFAHGALQAARFIAGCKPGLYTMEDALNLKVV